MKLKTRISILILCCTAAFFAAVCLGSVSVSLTDTLRVLSNRIFSADFKVDDIISSIVWSMRLPRAVMAFLVGAALAASGAVMQSVLRNPLASSYTLGVSSGASLGAAAVMITGTASGLLGAFTLPAAGFVSGLATVFLAFGLAYRLDCNMENQTIILVGMVFSLFVNALLTLLTAFSGDHLKQLIYWQMGSFNSKSWIQILVMTVILIFGLAVIIIHSRELDIMTFGEEQALSSGVELKKVKLTLIGASALITGCAVSFSGVIGFIDLIAPHVVRRIFGSSHRRLVPLCAVFGGSFMALADLISRTVITPKELPVGAVTALVGAPFFAYVYFHGRSGRIKGGRHAKGK